MPPLPASRQNDVKSSYISMVFDRDQIPFSQTPTSFLAQDRPKRMHIDIGIGLSWVGAGKRGRVYFDWF